jgi:hypothetical protein
VDSLAVKSYEVSFSQDLAEANPQTKEALYLPTKTSWTYVRVSGLSTLRERREPELFSLDTLGASASKFHKYSGAARFAANSIAFAMKGFKIAAYCAFVINEFNHILRLQSTRTTTLS